MKADEPAYPCADSQLPYPGLTKAEYARIAFTAAALQGICANPTTCSKADDIAKAAIIAADATLSALNNETVKGQ